MADATKMGTDIATEITTAEAALVGTETDAQIRTAMMIALASGIIPNVDALNANSTTGSGASSLGHYGRMVRVTLDAQYESFSTLVAVSGSNSGSATHAWALLEMRVKQQAALGSPPIVNLQVVAASVYLNTSFVAVTTQNDASATVVELYGSTVNQHEDVRFSVLHSAFGGTPSYDFTAGALQAALPAGTQTPATWASVRNPVMQPEGATALQWDATAWKIGTDDVYHAGNLPKATAATPSTLAERDAAGAITATQFIGPTSGTASAISPGANINGVLFTGASAISVNTVQAVTFNNGGAGAASGTTFNGGTARTISYNTVGAAAASHTHPTSEITGLDTALGNYLPLSGGTLSNGAANTILTMSSSTYGGYIRHGASTGLMSLSGGSSSSNGANVLLYGGSHATEPSKGALRVATTDILTWDTSVVDLSTHLALERVSPHIRMRNTDTGHVGNNFEIANYQSGLMFTKVSGTSWQSNLMRLDWTTGNLAIGTHTAIKKLDVLTGTSTEGVVFRSSTGASNVAGHLWPGSGGFVIDSRLGNLTGAANLHIRTGGTDRIHISNTGTTTISGTLVIPTK